MASVVFQPPKQRPATPESKGSAWRRAFTDDQRHAMEQDDYLIGARIFGILSVIFAIGLVLTLIAVLASEHFLP